MSTVISSGSYFVVFATKYRRPVLSDEIRTRLVGTLHETADEFGFTISGLSVAADHVRLLLEVGPQFGLHRAVKALKRNSSRVLTGEFPRLRSRLPSLWTNNYFAAAVGPMEAANDAARKFLSSQRGV